MPRPVVAWFRGPLRWLFAVPLIVLFYVAGLSIYWPFTKQALVDLLQERTLQQVSVNSFRNTYWPPGCVAEGITFLPRDGSEPSPKLAIRRVMVKGSYLYLTTFQRRVTEFDIEGFRLSVPALQPSSKAVSVLPLTVSPSGRNIFIDLVNADGAIADFGSPPSQVTARQLVLRHVDAFTPLTYELILVSNKFSGELHASGAWGPWKLHDPRSTTIHGRYVYQNANLAAFDGLAGMLHSSGTFVGNFASVGIDSDLDVDKFQVRGSSHRREVKAQLQAVVNVQNGDALLQRLVVQFDRTALLVKGKISKTVLLDVYSDRARVEDLFNLFISGREPPITGKLASLHAHLELPPGLQPYLVCLKLNGSFGIDNTRITDEALSRDIARISVSATEGDKEEIRENQQSVVADLNGQVALADGIAHLSNIVFRVPGARASMSGTFDLVRNRIDMTGILVTEGKLSDAVTGFRSVLMKALMPFLGKNGKVKSLPFTVTGPFGHTSVGLNIGAKKQ